jgi:hypothetical protein
VQVLGQDFLLKSYRTIPWWDSISRPVSKVTGGDDTIRPRLRRRTFFPLFLA